MAPKTPPDATLPPELAVQVDACPPELSEAGAALWRSIAGTWVLRPDELRVLRDVCSEADLVDRLEHEMRNGPLTVLGSQGQPVAAPAVQELRQHRGTLASLLRQLKLPDEDDADAGGGLTKAQKSAAARAAARARWDRRSG